MMRAVVDTNILIRALIKPYGTVGPVITHLRDGHFVIVYSTPLLNELTIKLALPRIRVKYCVRTEHVEALVSTIVLRGERVIPTRQIKLCRDPDDDMFVKAAAAGQAPYVVTGDDDLLTLKKFESVQFITPRAFLAALDGVLSET
jgi:putative PIN family toxin of toxin-antitoxin system